MDMKDTNKFVHQLYTAMEVQGFDVEKQREHLVNELKRQSHQAERLLLGQIMQSPMNGMKFVETIQILLGAVNEVVVEKDQQPLHISELGLATVITAIEYFDKDIDSLYQEYKEGTLFS